MQRGKSDSFGVIVVPRLKRGHYFVSFCEEFWDGMKNATMGRIEVFKPGEIYASLPELRFYFSNTPVAGAAWNLYREHYDFVNVTERELRIMTENLKLFQQEESDA